MYDLSFSEEFFMGQPDGEIGGDDFQYLYPITPRPQSVIEALLSEEHHNPKAFREMIKEVLGYSLEVKQSVDDILYCELLDKIKEYNTCDTLTPPIQVYINKDHYVTVYEDLEDEVA